VEVASTLGAQGGGFLLGDPLRHHIAIDDVVATEQGRDSRPVREGRGEDRKYLRGVITEEGRQELVEVWTRRPARSPRK
jgi:hypothetical protein